MLGCLKRVQLCEDTDGGFSFLLYDDSLTFGDGETEGKL